MIDVNQQDLCMKRKEEILANFWGRKGDELLCSKDIFFANTKGFMFSQQQLNLEPDSEKTDQVASISILKSNNNLVLKEISPLQSQKVGLFKLKKI